MDQKPYRSRALIAWVLRCIAILSPVQPAKTEGAPHAEVPLCNDLVGQPDIDTEQILNLLKAAPGPNARRFAVVIGNNYPGRASADGSFKVYPSAVPRLKNAVNDAKAIAGKLINLKFKVACFLNVPAEVHARILSQAPSIKAPNSNALTLYYFAGHGFAAETETYLVGDGAKRDSDENLIRFSTHQTDVMSWLRTRGGPLVAIFDMCRERLDVEVSSSNRGPGLNALKRYTPISKEPGLLAHYSTSPAEYAADLPTQSNGLYARVFLDLVPHYPGNSVEEFLNDILGATLVKGIKIEDKVYKQTPHMEAYPDDWRYIAIYDASDASELAKTIAEVRHLEPFFGERSVTHACEVLRGAQRDWSSAPNPDGLNTVDELLDLIKDLYKKIESLGYDCDQLRSKQMVASQFLPPVSYVAKSQVTLTSAKNFPEAIEFAEPGRWLSTNAVSLPLEVTKGGTYSIPNRVPVDLNNAFALPRKVSISKNVYFTEIGRSNLKLDNTKDQIVVQFNANTSDIIDLEGFEAKVRNLNFSNSGTSLVILILAPHNPHEKNHLNWLRMSQNRLLAIVSRLAKAGIPYEKIVAPDPDKPTPISISTLQDNEVLMKITGFSFGALELLSPNSLKPDHVPDSAKESLKLYEASTRNSNIPW